MPCKRTHISTRNPAKRNQPSTCNPPKLHQLSTRNLPKRNCRGGHPRTILSSKMRRGGACVPARTSAQRRFHNKNTHIVREELNDGCALAGRHGRAHRHRPYQSPSYFSTQSTPTKSTIHAQSARTFVQRRLHTQMNEYNYTTHTSGVEMHRALPPPFFEIKK